MELDDLKIIWKESRTKVTTSGEPQVHILKAITQSEKRIQRVLTIEIVLTIILYGLFFAAVFSIQNIPSYQYKLVIVVGLFAAFIFYRMYKSLRFLRRIDFGKNVHTTLIRFLLHYKITLKLYQWGGYFTILVLFLLFFTDSSFLELQLWVKGLIVVHLLITMLAVGPVVKRVYGRKIQSIERFLNDLD